VLVLLQIFSWFWQCNNVENRLIFGKVKACKNCAIFWATLYLFYSKTWNETLISKTNYCWNERESFRVINMSQLQQRSLVKAAVTWTTTIRKFVVNILLQADNMLHMNIVINTPTTRFVGRYDMFNYLFIYLLFKLWLLECSSPVMVICLWTKFALEMFHHLQAAHGLWTSAAWETNWEETMSRGTVCGKYFKSSVWGSNAMSGEGMSRSTAGLTIRGAHPNVRRGPFSHTRSHKIFSGRALISLGVHFSSPQKLTFFSPRRYV